MKKYILEIIVFVCGANLMIFELVGSRLLAPYLGSGIFVWSSIIGVILGSLSIGYWLGGKISDMGANKRGLSIILLFLAFSVGFTTFYKDGTLVLISSIFSLKIGSIIASIILFSSSSILFGIISPYAASLKIKELKKAGSTVGNLYAISTGGSIFGTFLAGFFLIPTIGSANIILIIAISSFILSIIVFMENKKYIKFMAVFILILIVFGKFSKINLSASEINEDVDTQYSRILVYDIKNKEGKMTRVLKTNPSGVQSHMLVDSPVELLTSYGKFYDLGQYFNPGFKKTLLLGGGGYSYPKHFLEKFKEAQIDVVEIDPGMTKIAKKYFYLKDDPRMRIIHQDARVFLNKNENKYDVIFKDAFNSYYSIPFQLTTKEFIEREYNSLNDNGVVFVNIISAIKGKDNEFLNLEYNTYKSVFNKVYLFKVNLSADNNSLQSVVLAAIKGNKNESLYDKNEEYEELLNNKIEEDFKIKNDILVDDFAPVDYNSRAVF